MSEPCKYSAPGPTTGVAAWIRSRTALSLWMVAILTGSGDAAAQTEKTQKGSAVTDKAAPRHTNRLAQATSPYLLQHAHNPVDWYEWGPEAFEEARNRDKVVFLSIGYSACHWCHVMAHESFEDEEVAALLNLSFVSIKVDREERPDIDEIYMAYTQALTQHGGWPMSVWITPDGTPFHAGTYFPRNDFLQLLQNITDGWNEDRESITKPADSAKAFFSRWGSRAAPTDTAISLKTVDESALQLVRYFDRTLGGLESAANKFPPSMTMDLLLRVYRRTGKAELLEAVDVTLDNMARGGIHDQLGGGFCRYSTDPRWLVPHFEKMLYDQALVASIYLDATQLTKNPLYTRTAADILDYVIDDLQSKEGGFYSSRDADSEGLEGTFYIWTVEQVREVLGEEESRLCCAFFDVSSKGNWFEHLGHAPPGPKNVLRIIKPRKAFAKLHGLDPVDLDRRIDSWRRKLLAARSKRTPPGLDDKVLTGWNGLMIASLAKGARVLNEPRYAKAAAGAADFILTKLRVEGRLLRSYRNGQAHLMGYLNDYAFFIEGLLNLYEATFDPKWLREAKALTDTSIKYYYDPRDGGFFFTANDAEKLIARSKQPRDQAIPSGNSVHAMNLLRLAILFDRKDYREKAESIFKAFGAEAAQSPGAFDRLLCAADFAQDVVKEIAIIGDPAWKETLDLVHTVYDRYLPNKLVVGASDVQTKTDIPLLKAKTRRKGRSAAYVCENYRCRLPVTEPDALAKQLE